MADIEHRFDLKSICYILADQLITNSLLQSLDIMDTCTLCCDYYHVYEDVWQSKFSASSWQRISNHMKALLDSKTKAQFEYNADEAIRIVVVSNFDERDYILMIKNKPEYYAEYFFCEQGYSMGIKGSYHAKQNHSGVVSYMGGGDKFGYC